MAEKVSTSPPTFERERPNLLLRIGFKIPPLIYYGPIASLMASRCVIRLTTTGRKSGKPRTICVSAMPVDHGYVLFSGFGIKSNWYQNLLANPEAVIKVGRKTHSVTAMVVDDPDQRRNLMIRMRDRSASCGPPTFIRPVLELTKVFDYDAEIQMAVDNAEELPVVILKVVEDE